jgi:DNA-binding LytR/AlgR family response regulator
MDVIRTLVVDDESPARSRLLELLQREPHIKVVGVARDGREALNLIHTQTPHLMFLDILEASGVYVHLHVGQKTHLYRSSVAHLLQRLDPKRFVRVHRSAAVNTDRIRELQPRSHGDYTVVLKDGTELIMSRGYRSEFEVWLRQPL